MDTTKTITHVSLCAGYGGIDLGLGRAIPNLRTIAFSEIEAFACANLVAKMEAGLLDAAPIWTNLKTFPWSEFRDRVDILSGGYPCQPFSAAGKRLGKDDPRHLWPFIADGIRILRPRVCFFENVEGHISLGLREVISELEGLGYQTAWGIFSAREVGAPHQRKRVFILAYLCSEGLEGLRECCDTQGREAQIGHTGSGSHVWPSRPGQPQHGWEPPRVVGNTILHGHATSEITGSTSQSEDEGWMQESEGGSSSVGDSKGEQGSPRNHREEPRTPSQPQQEQSRGGNCGSLRESNRQTQPSLGGDSDGAADRMDDAELFITSDNRTDELRLLGNGVVPATAERAFRTLLTELQ